jgi:NAD(P)-dependent dehydrogenase (short-subunit alcohol dehydrogenase family)
LGRGESIARRLAFEKYAVCVNGVQANKSGIDTLVAELNKEHGEGTAIGVVADVTKSSEVQSMIQESVKALGLLTVMIANAGIAQVAPVLDISEDDVRKMFDVSFMGWWNCYTLAAKQMISQGPVPEGSTGYKILGPASIVAFKPFPMLSHYSASKWVVRGFTQVFAMEMAQHAITVNAYAAGIFGKAMWDLIDEKLGEVEGRAETVLKYSKELTALGRVSVPEDVSKVVGGFLCSDDCSLDCFYLAIVVRYRVHHVFPTADIDSLGRVSLPIVFRCRSPVKPCFTVCVAELLASQSMNLQTGNRYFSMLQYLLLTPSHSSSSLGTWISCQSTSKPASNKSISTTFWYTS